MGYENAIAKSSHSILAGEALVKAVGGGLVIKCNAVWSDGL